MTNVVNAGKYQSPVDLHRSCYEDLMALVDPVTEPVPANGKMPRGQPLCQIGFLFRIKNRFVPKLQKFISLVLQIQK
jgi:hypothetical protein